MTTLTPANLDLIYDVARVRFLSRDQLTRLHYAHAKPKTSMNRLAELEDGYGESWALERPGFLAWRRFLPVERASLDGRPMKAYAWVGHNQTQLKRYLSERRMIPEWSCLRPPFDESFASIARDTPATIAFSEKTMPHHIGVSETIIWLEKMIQAEGWGLVGWERLHRGSPMNTTVRVDGEWCKVEPDVFWCVRRPGSEPGRGYRFGVLEYENHEKSPNEFMPKLRGFVGYLHQGKWTEELGRINAHYGLGMSDETISRAGFHVLTVARSAEQRDALFLKSLELNQPVMFLFAALPQLTWGAGFEPVWLRGQEFAEAWTRDGRQFPAAAKPSIRERWMEDFVDALPRVSMVM